MREVPMFIDYEDALAWLMILVALFMLASCGDHPDRVVPVVCEPAHQPVMITI